MPSHWTYEKKRKPGGDLYQGDIIDRTPRLLKVLGSVHGYFCDPKYLGFIVTSQTYNLVVRDGDCKANYINLAVIRPLESLLPSVIKESCGSQIPGVYYTEGKGEIKNLVERIINQNEQTHGLFYLEPDGDLKLAVASVALLRVSIALRSKEHYRIIKAARVGRLRPSFRNKLGWLTGNLYSRVDTPDWPEEIGYEEAKTKVDRILKDVDEAANNIWVSKKQLDYSLIKDPSIKTLPRDKVRDAIQPFAPPKPIEAVISKVKEHMLPLLSVISMTDIKAAAELLRSDRVFVRLVADRICVAAEPLLDATQLSAFAERLKSDARMREAGANSIGRFAEQFFRTRFNKDYPSLISVFDGRPIFDPEWMSLVIEHLDSIGVNEEAHSGLIVTLEGIKPDDAMSDFFSMLIQAAAGKGLGERLAKRLRGDAPLNSLLSAI